MVLSPLVAVEWTVRLFVPVPPAVAEDPYVSFSGTRPLFVLDSAGRRFETARERLAFFCRQSFAAVKPADGFRIFVLGGSTVQGRPYSAETSFTTWLELNLRAARPETSWEAINCGGVSYASYRLVPVLREVLQYEPDLIVLYTGHNEFLEDRSYGRVRRAPKFLIGVHRALLNLRTYALADRWLARRRGDDPANSVLPAEVQARLDFQGGLDAYHRDESWRRGTIAHFAHNLEAMVRLTRENAVPLILMNPVSNLKDCPPFKSEFRADLSETQRRAMVEFMNRAQATDWSDAYARIRLLEQAVDIDDRYANLLYHLGLCHERLGRSDEAMRWFVRAKEQDVCPLRMLEAMHEVVRRTASAKGVPLVDVRGLVVERTPDNIPGDEWLLDHVHPTIEAHQFIADALYRQVERLDLIRTPEGWKRARDELRRRHLDSLDDAYYAHGAARLKRLHEWSRGRIPAGRDLNPDGL